jgi:hypothetical protein
MSGDEVRSEEWQTKAYGLNFALTAPIGQVAVEKMVEPSDKRMQSPRASASFCIPE